MNFSSIWFFIKDTCQHLNIERNSAEQLMDKVADATKSDFVGNYVFSGEDIRKPKDS